MESVCVTDVDAATEFLTQLLNASSNVVANISVEHSVLRWEGRQVLVHGDKLGFLLSNNRLFLNADNVSSLAENARRLFPGAVITHYSSSSLPGCLILGPGGLEISALQCGVSGQKHDNLYFSALRAASELCCAQELNNAAITEAVNGITSEDKSRRNPAGTNYRSLFPLLYDSSTFRPISCNTSVPIPFKTELFDGVAMLLVNSSDDPNQVIDQSQWTFEVQVQGKFTRRPEGPLFIGAQISKKMELGMLTRAMCRTIMQFARSNLPLLHHSFGDSGDVELPHIVGPLWMMSDRVVVTPKGELPPQLGAQILPEDEDSRRARRKNSSFDGVVVDLDSTYSFSTDTANIELIDWSVVNIPLLSKLDLHTFWLDADLILCAYELKSPEPAITKHRQEDITYCFRLLLRHSSNHHNLSHYDDAPTSGELAYTGEATQDETNNKVMRDLAGCSGGYEVISSAEDRQQNEYSFNDFDDEDESESVFMNESARIAGTSLYSSIDVPPSVLVSAVPWENFTFIPVIFEVDDFRKKSSGKRRLYYGIQFPSSFEVSDSVSKLNMGGRMSLHSYMECTKTLSSLTPHYIKPCNYSRLNECAQRRLQLNALFLSIYKSVQSRSITTMTQKKLFSLFSDGKPTEELLDPGKNISSEYGVSSRRHREGIGATLCHSRVCVQLGRFYWSEEYMMLTSTELVFVKPASRLGRTARVRIRLTELYEVSLIPYDQGLFDGPAPEFSFLAISTFSKEYHIAVRGHAVRDRWLSMFSSCLTRRPPYADTHNLSMVTILSDKARDHEGGADGGEESIYLQDMNMLSTPMGFNLGDRVILNARKFQANPFEVVDFDSETVTTAAEKFGVSKSQSTLESLISAENGSAEMSALRVASLSGGEGAECKLSDLFPADVKLPFVRDGRYVLHIDLISKIVAEALDLILSICERMIIKENDVSITDPSGSIHMWMMFMDKISALSNIEIDFATYDPGDAAALATFLNLYHTLLLHSFVAVRVPSSALNWPSLFNCCAYEAFGDIFSISELEHGVLRNGMSKPSSFIAQMLIPKSVYGFALTVKDLRLLWAMNCGSSSLAESIPVYNKDTLNSQLNYNIRLSLFTQFKYNPADQTLTLPILCLWYQQDLVGRLDSRGSKFDIIKALLPFLGPTETAAMYALLDKEHVSHHNFTIVYSPFDFSLVLSLIRHVQVSHTGEANMSHLAVRGSYWIYEQ